MQILICIIDLVAFAAIFKWRKWGFWLYVFNTLVDFGSYTLLYREFDNIIYCTLAVAIFYGFLSIGRKNKAWPQLD